MTTESTPTKIDLFKGRYHFLSNFYLMAIVYEGVKYDSVEHAYQAAKTLDPNERETIRRCTKPGGAKRLGRSVTLRPGWDKLRIEVMTELLTQKFSDPVLREQLLATGSAELIEGNDWRDTFWGVYHGKGQNNLGKLLMMVRSKLEAEDERAIGDDWEATNARRVELITMRESEGLSGEELRELNRLQRLADKRIRAVAPLPITTVEAALADAQSEIRDAAAVSHDRVK